MKNIYIEPRVSGKTTKLIDRFIECINSDKSVYLFCMNSSERKRIIKIVKEKLNCFRIETELEKMVFTVNEETYRNLQCTTHNECVILVDEYFLFNEHQKIIIRDLFLNNFSKCEWIIRTTSNKLFDEKIMFLVRAIKETNNKNVLFKSIKEFMSITDKIEFEEMFNSLLSEPKITIICARHLVSTKMSKEQFETQVMGKFLKI